MNEKQLPPLPHVWSDDAAISFIRQPATVQNSCHFQRMRNVSKLASPAKLNRITNVRRLLLQLPNRANTFPGPRIRLGRPPNLTNGRSIPNHYSFSARLPFSECNNQNALLFEESVRMPGGHFGSKQGNNTRFLPAKRQASRPGRRRRWRRWPRSVLRDATA